MEGKYKIQSWVVSDKEWGSCKTYMEGGSKVVKEGRSY